MSIALEVTNLGFAYQDAENKALDGINFTLHEGEFLCIIGQNESGKSSLCNALVGLIPHFFTGDLYGDVLVFGDNTRTNTIAQMASKIGLVFQNPFNQLSYTTTTVAEELAYGLGNLGVPREEMRRRVKEVSELMRIDHLLNRNPLELSGGQVQRVAIGSAFIMQPRILVLDECTAQLDPLGSAEVFDVIDRLKEKGYTIVVVDHDMERVAKYASKVLVLDHAKQIAFGTPKEIFAQDLSAYNIQSPDYAQLTHAYGSLGWWDGQPALQEEEAVAITKEILGQ